MLYLVTEYASKGEIFGERMENTLVNTSNKPEFKFWYEISSMLLINDKPEFSYVTVAV